MPKERRGRSVSIGKSTFSPYRCNTSETKQSLVNTALENENNLKEWEDARCPICMEHPHNALLLLCSSHDKGCRPYMCDTSYRHSNCFDQFRKSFSESQTEQSQPSMTTGNDEKSKLLCPLCRGEVNGCVVVNPARLFMNNKTRSCASEICDFSGTYADLREHARLVHPSVRPSEVDPMRQRDWRKMESQRDLQDLLSALQSSDSEEQDEESTSGISVDNGGRFTPFFLITGFQRESISGPVSSRTRTREMLRRGEARVDVDSESSNGELGFGLRSFILFQLIRSFL